VDNPGMFNIPLPLTFTPIDKGFVYCLLLRLGAIAMSCFTMLKEKGLKLTSQRKLILDVIHDTQRRLTAEEIISYVQSKMPGVHKPTIYRTLELLGEAGCVFKSEIGDHLIYHHAETGHHHHLVCRRCGKTIDLDENFFAPVEKLLGEIHSFQVDLGHVVISGLCESCQN